MRRPLLSLLACISLTMSAQDFASLDSLMQSRYSTDAPGIAIIIARGDSVLYERYAGLADMLIPEPIGPDTRFCIASVSKQFTTMALLQQAARHSGEMPLLDTPVADLTGYPAQPWADITLRNLLSHTSGIPDARPRTDRQWCVLADEDDSVAYLPTVESTTFGPGEYYDYLNPSFVLVAKIVEQLASEPFNSYLYKHIFAQAGMSETYCFDRNHPGPGQSHAYAPAQDGGWDEYDFGEETFFATVPDGAIYTTARDLLKWENALRDGAIVAPAWRDLAYRPTISVAASPMCDYQRRPDTWYGLGFFVEHPAGKPPKVFHTGDNGGYQAYLAKYPAEDIKIIVLENRHDHSRHELAVLIDKILDLR